MKRALLIFFSLFFCLSRSLAQLGPLIEEGPPQMEHTRILSFDTDGDGDLDIVLNAEMKKDIIRFENLGGGAFSEPQVVWEDLTTGMGLDYADLDMDGDLDLIASPSYDGNMAWLENDGNGIFTVLHEIGIDNEAPEVFDVADMDADGDPDLVVVIPGITVNADLVWLENSGSGDFAAPEMLIESTWDMAKLEVQFVNDDELPDLLYTRTFGGLSVLLNTGELNFQPPLFLSGADEIMDFRVGDIDNDGDLDLCGYRDDNNLDFLWWEQTETGDFDYRSINGIIFLEQSLAIDLFDVDNDGDLDALGSYRDPDTDEFVVSWFEYTGGEVIAFEPPQPFNTYNHRTHLIVSEDFTGNGFEDVVELSLSADKVTFTPHSGNGNFENPVELTRNLFFPNYCGHHDFNNDNQPEMLVTGSFDSKIGYLPNLGNGDFGELVVLNDSAYDVIDFNLTDFDGDSDEDILWVATTNTGD